MMNKLIETLILGIPLWGVLAGLITLANRFLLSHRPFRIKRMEAHLPLTPLDAMDLGGEPPATVETMIETAAQTMISGMEQMH